jgi:hypothetical protein
MSKRLTDTSCNKSHPEAKPCSRCNGTGHINTQVMYNGNPGACFKCGGKGYFGGDTVELSRLPKALAQTAIDGKCSAGFLATSKAALASAIEDGSYNDRAIAVMERKVADSQERLDAWRAKWVAIRNRIRYLEAKAA